MHGQLGDNHGAHVLPLHCAVPSLWDSEHERAAPPSQGHNVLAADICSCHSPGLTFHNFSSSEDPFLFMLFGSVIYVTHCKNSGAPLKQHPERDELIKMDLQPFRISNF